MTTQHDMLTLAREVVRTRAETVSILPSDQTQAFAVGCCMDLMQRETEAQDQAAAQGDPIAIILAACEERRHGPSYDGTYDIILDHLTALKTRSDAAFRRGATAAIQAAVDDLSALIARREQAHSPELATNVIRGIALRVAKVAVPAEDPGPVSMEQPTVPRPPLDELIRVACLEAESSGLAVQLQVGTDGITVLGHRLAPRAPAIRRVAWESILQATVPVLSLEVRAVLEELRSS